MRKHCSQVVLENFFEPCLLYLLLEKPGYGYELYQKLTASCLCSINMGNMYRKLNSLAHDGYIAKSKQKGTLGPDKTVYAITTAGKKHLSVWIANLEKQSETISMLITNYKKYHVTAQ